jgi:hypothetical protein
LRTIRRSSKEARTMSIGVEEMMGCPHGRVSNGPGPFPVCVDCGEFVPSEYVVSHALEQILATTAAPADVGRAGNARRAPRSGPATPPE